MCLFLSAEDQVDVYWVNETILITPEGPNSKSEVRVIVNGLIRPKENNKGVTINFAHRGEIYSLEDWSPEWFHATKKPNGDWLSSNVLNNNELGTIPMIEPKGNNNLLVRLRNEAKEFLVNVVNIKQNILSDIEVYCGKGDYKHPISKMPTKACFAEYTPIYSSFSLSLKDPKPENQLFRITYCTKAGVHPYHSQINVDVEGPDALPECIKLEIDKKVTEKGRHDKLCQQIAKLPKYRENTGLDLAIVSHPTTSLTIEYAEHTSDKRPIEFPLESSKTTVIESAACEGRVAFFVGNNRNAIIKAVATPVVVEYPRQHSPEFFEMLNDLRKELEKG